MKELNYFKKVTREELWDMSDREVYGLNDSAKIERYLILNGYVDHDLARKIEMVDVYSVGADSVSFTILTTKRRCRKPSIAHHFVLDQVHGRMELIGFDNL